METFATISLYRHYFYWKAFFQHYLQAFRERNYCGINYLIHERPRNYLVDEVVPAEVQIYPSKLSACLSVWAIFRRAAEWSPLQPGNNSPKFSRSTNWVESCTRIRELVLPRLYRIDYSKPRNCMPGKHQVLERISSWDSNGSESVCNKVIFLSKLIARRTVAQGEDRIVRSMYTL